MLPEAARTVGRQEGAETGEAAGSGHGHVWCVTCHVLSRIVTCHVQCHVHIRMKAGTDWSLCHYYATCLRNRPNWFSDSSLFLVASCFLAKRLLERSEDRLMVNSVTRRLQGMSPEVTYLCCLLSAHLASLPLSLPHGWPWPVPVSVSVYMYTMRITRHPHDTGYSVTLYCGNICLQGCHSKY